MNAHIAKEKIVSLLTLIHEGLSRNVLNGQYVALGSLAEVAFSGLANNDPATHKAFNKEITRLITSIETKLAAVSPNRSIIELNSHLQTIKSSIEKQEKGFNITEAPAYFSRKDLTESSSVTMSALLDALDEMENDASLLNEPKRVAPAPKQKAQTPAQPAEKAISAPKMMTSTLTYSAIPSDPRKTLIGQLSEIISNLIDKEGKLGNKNVKLIYFPLFEKLEKLRDKLAEILADKTIEEAERNKRYIDELAAVSFVSVILEITNSLHKKETKNTDENIFFTSLQESMLEKVAKQEEETNDEPMKEQIRSEVRKVTSQARALIEKTYDQLKKSQVVNSPKPPQRDNSTAGITAALAKPVDELLIARKNAHDSRRALAKKINQYWEIKCNESRHTDRTKSDYDISEERNKKIITGIVQSLEKYINENLQTSRSKKEMTSLLNNLKTIQVRLIDNELIQNVEPHKKRLGMIFEHIEKQVNSKTDLSFLNRLNEFLNICNNTIPLQTLKTASLPIMPQAIRQQVPKLNESEPAPAPLKQSKKEDKPVLVTKSWETLFQQASQQAAATGAQLLNQGVNYLFKKLSS